LSPFCGHGCNTQITLSTHDEKAVARVGRPCIGFARFFFMQKPDAHARTGKPSAIAIVTGIKTFHEWLAERQRRQCEGLWLNDKNAVIGLSKMNPLPRDSAVNKSLSKKPKPPLSGVPVFKPWKPTRPAKLHFVKPAQPAKIVMQKPNALKPTQLLRHPLAQSGGGDDAFVCGGASAFEMVRRKFFGSISSGEVSGFDSTCT